MRTIRLAVAALLLVWPPLSSTLADALEVSLAHHHCDEPGHAHDGSGLVAQAEEPSGHLDLDPVNCSDCHLVAAALPLAEPALTPPARSRYSADVRPGAATAAAGSLFRPPIA